MPQRRSFLFDLLKLLLFVLLLPITVLLIGPVLVIAAIVGRLPIGPLEFNPAQGGIRRRGAALISGIALWLLVWAGLGWLWLMVGQRTTSLPIAARPSATAAVIISTEAPSTPVPFTPTTSPIVETPTNTARPPTATPIVTTTPASSATAESAETPTATPRPSDTPQPTAHPTITVTPAPTSSPPLPAATLSPDDQAAALAAVDRANTLLAAAIASPSQGNLDNLASAWRGEGLEQVRTFAQDIYSRYLQPLRVEYQYLDPPGLQEQIDAQTVVVRSREVWTYTGPNRSEREAFAFSYTVSRTEAGWFVADYRFTNVPLETPAVTLTATITATLAITP